jgi:hypothetical protein
MILFLIDSAHLSNITRYFCCVVAFQQTFVHFFKQKSLSRKRRGGTDHFTMMIIHGKSPDVRNCRGNQVHLSLVQKRLSIFRGFSAGGGFQGFQAARTTFVIKITKDAKYHLNLFV